MHCGQFHSTKNPTVEYQISNNCLIFVFGAKPSYHDIGIIWFLVEEEFNFGKQNMKTIGWSEKFGIDIKNEEFDLLFANYYREIFR